MDLDLTLILATRNDRYNGDPMARLRVSLTRTLANAEAAGMPMDGLEIIVCDWGSEEPVKNAVPFHPALRHLHVSKTKADSYETFFYETKALNLAARGARGKWIGRMDQDTIVGRRFFEWYVAGNMEAGSVYFSPRRQLPPSVEEEQDGNNHNDPPTRTAYDSAVGMFLLEREVWHRHRGYCEAMRFFNHIEVEFLTRLDKEHPIRFFAPEIDMPFYHLWHSRHDADPRKQNELTPVPNGEDWGTL